MSDPLAPDYQDALAMTHQPSQPDPGQRYLDMIRRGAAAAGAFAQGGITGVMQQQGMQTPEWSNRVGDVLQSEAANTAMGMATPLKGAKDWVGAIKAFHASPHDFDRFDFSKIGTGEGAQVFGHGGYFSANELVSGRGGEYDKKFTAQTGKPAHIYEVSINADPEHFLDWDKPLSEQSEHVQKALKPFNLKDTEEGGYMHQEIYRQLGGDTQEGVTKAADALRQAGIPGIKYLDQGSRPAPNQVQLARELDLHQQILADAQQSGDPRRIADAQSKIKNIQERMAPSRPTSNYVVFDDKTVDILKKYGLLGLFGGGAASQIQDSDPLAR